MARSTAAATLLAISTTAAFQLSSNLSSQHTHQRLSVLRMSSEAAAGNGSPSARPQRPSRNGRRPGPRGSSPTSALASSVQQPKMALPIFNPATDLLMPDADEDEALAPVDDVDAAFMAQIAAATGSGSTGDDSQDAAADEATSDPRGRTRQPKRVGRGWKEALEAFRAMCLRDDRPGSAPPPRAAADMALEVAAQCGRWDAGMEVVELMRAQGVAPRVSTYKALLRSWRGARDGQAAFVVTVVGAMAAARVAPDLELLEMGTAMCARVGGVTEALYFLGQASVLGYAPSEAMYEACVSALAAGGRWQRAADLIRDGEAALGRPLRAESRTLVIRAAGRAGQWRAAVLTLQEMQAGRDRGWREESWPTSQTYAAAISACALSGEWQRGVELLEGMLRGPHALPPSLLAFNAAMSACERARQWRKALQLLKQAEGLGLKPDVITYNTAISACAKGGQWNMALGLLATMRNQGVRPDRISYNAAISACASVAGDDATAFKKAIELLDEMRRRGLKADKFSYSSAIKACARAKDSAKALQLLNQMRVTSVAIDVVAYTSAMDACAATGRWQEGIELLDEMRSKGLQPNERTYRAAIAACGKGGQWQRVLDLLASMRSKGFAIAAPTFNSAVAACEKGGQHAHALALMQQMRAQGTEPDLFTYGSAINACSTGGHWKEALALLEEMRSTVSGPALQPNVICYTAAITAAGRGGEAQLALDLLAQMRADGLTPDAIAFNAVINACRRGGLYHAALETLDAMRAAGHAPDLATITDMVTALEEGGLREAADAVYADATARGALPDSVLDSDWEFDVSALPPAVARLKVRAVLRGVLAAARNNGGAAPAAEDLVFVCGTGVQRSVRGARERRFDMRSYLSAVLATEYTPPLAAHTPPMQAGCIAVPRERVAAWIAAHIDGPHVGAAAGAAAAAAVPGGPAATAAA